MLKEKLKGTKSRLKVWNKEHCANLESQTLKAKDELAKIDLKGEANSLSLEEEDCRRQCYVNIHRLSSLNCSFLWQKSRMRWLKEGDANSKFFHRCIQRRRKVNEILGLVFYDVLVEEVEPLRERIGGFFDNHFKSDDWARPSFGSINIPSLGVAENEFFVLHSWRMRLSLLCGSVRIIRVWVLTGSLSLLLSSFGVRSKRILLLFWKFHRNGRLVKGSNCIFIVLNPKEGKPADC